jgi:hypothetical protein
MFNEEQLIVMNNLKNNLLKYDDSLKVHKFISIKKIFGFRLSVLIMRYYLFLKNNGLFKF